MNKAFLRPGALIAGVALCLGATGTWKLWHRAQASANTVNAAPAPSSTNAAPAADAMNLLTALPKTASGSASDLAIAKWAGKARENVGSDKAWIGLGDALMQKARETADAAYYGYAESAFKQGLTTNPRSGEAMTGLAWVSGGRHDFDQSIAWANKALALDPRSNLAYGIIGDAQVEQGQYDAAFENLQKMLDIRPDISSYSRGAYLLHITGDNRKARWLMAKAILAGAPYAENTAWCRSRLGLILLSDGNLLAAEQVLAEALKKTPHNYHVLVAMGKVKTARKDFPAAIELYKQAIAVVPQQEAVVALGDLYRATGQTEAAEKQYALVETIHKLQKASGVRGDMQLAMFYADHDRSLPEALTLAQNEYKTIKNVYAADTLAWCYYKNQRYAEAKTASEAALSRNTPEALFLFHAGMINAKLNDRVTASKYLYRALSLNPNFSPTEVAVAAATLKDFGSRPFDDSVIQAQARMSPSTSLPAPQSLPNAPTPVQTR